MLVHTAETVRFRYFVDLLMEHRRPVMLVGSAGCGKTVLINDKLSSKSEYGAFWQALDALASVKIYYQRPSNYACTHAGFHYWMSCWGWE